jgi:hypothetical protein
VHADLLIAGQLEMMMYRDDPTRSVSRFRATVGDRSSDA